MRQSSRRPHVARFATFLGALLFWGAVVAPVTAQTFTIAFQKLSDTDDSVDDFRSGLPAVRQCPDPCQTVHVICRIINCNSAASDGTCINPNSRAITGGVFVDPLPITLPVDCSLGVVIGGAGTSDPAICDAASNSVTVNNIRVPGGETMTISFWANVQCDNGMVTNTATFDYDQNPNANPVNSRDPIGAFGASLLFAVGRLNVQAPTKDAPDLPIEGNPARRNGRWGISTPFVIEGNNPNCAPATFQSSWDDPNPDNCLDVDCSTLRFYVNNVPMPLPAGSLCPDPAHPGGFSFGSFTLQPSDTFRVTYDGTFTRDVSVGRCCNVMFFRTGSGPDVTTVDPGLDTRLNPEETCTNLALATATVLDAIKDAENSSGRVITQVAPGDDIYWHFTLTYDGAAPVDIVLSDDFPPSAVLTAGSIIDPFPTGTCTIAGQHLECTGVTLPIGSVPVEMRVRTSVDCSTVTGGTDICNEATVTAPGAPSATTHCSSCLPAAPANRTCVTMTAPAFDFANKDVTDAGANDLASVGEVLTYSIAARNTGNADATSVIITDTIPVDTSYVPGSLKLDGVALTDAPDGDAGEVVGGDVTVRVPLITVLDFTVGNVTFDVLVTGQSGPSVCNSAAQIEWAEAALCAQPPVAVAAACIDYEPIIAPPSLSASKRVAPSGSVDPGTTLTYTVAVCNAAGAGDAANVVITDDIPAGTTYVPGSMTVDGVPQTDAADGDEGSLVGAQVRFTIPSQTTGQCVVAQFQVLIDAGRTTDVTNVADILADSVAPFASNTVTTTIRGALPPDVSITKASAVVGGAPAEVGDTITYTLTACNAAAAGPASLVVIADPIPLDGASGCGGTYVASSLRVGGVLQTDVADGDAGRFEGAPTPGIVVDLATLAPGDCVEVTFDILVAAGCDDTEEVVNKATVSAQGASTAASNETRDAVTGGVLPPVPVMLRKVGFPLVNRCTDPPTCITSGCILGDRLDPVADDCVAAGTCTQLSVTQWRVPNDLNVHVPLVFYELHLGGCQPAGDPTRLAVTKDRPDDILLSLVP